MAKRTVKDFMTVTPVVIASDRPLAEAHRLMRERHIRHLPVMDGAALVGIVSQRDLYLVETLKGVDPELVPVREAMTPDPYAVEPEAALADVAAEMAARRCGSAIVVDRGSVIGVFTTVDALEALALLARHGRRRVDPARGGRAS